MPGTRSHLCSKVNPFLGMVRSNQRIKTRKGVIMFFLRSTIREVLAFADVWAHIARFDNDRTARFAISVAAGLVTTLTLFVIMQALIKSDMSPFSDLGKGQIIEFVRLKEEVEIPEVRPRPEPPPPPDEMPPDRPKIDFDPDTKEGVEIIREKFPPDDNGPIRPGFRADGDYLPIVKVAPVYPQRAQRRGIEGYVLLEFVVTTSGAVRDPVVVEAKPPGIFDRAAIEAALKFKYRPRVANGERMEVSGVRNLIKFELKGDG